MKAASVHALRRLLAAKAARGHRHLVRTGKVEIGKVRVVLNADTGLESSQPMTANEYTRAVIHGIKILDQGPVLQLAKRAGLL